ncbi:hypothetical protein BGY98DRAFT_1094571 [Russula aff. rugulosa BPL654]|nr:hypothetical protein BGY98DRAFT_1094571 [Russula aff. rugulosa BPL654]
MPLAVGNLPGTQVDVVTSSQAYLDTLKLWHAMSALYIWEFITTLDYEWKVIRGRLPYRWTIWIYSLTRMAALVGVILCLVIVNITTPINCQLLNVFSAACFCLSATTGSLLIVIRTIAIWNRNKVVMTLTTTMLSINIALHLQSLMRFRSVWVPAHFACETLKDPSLLSFIPAMISNMVLLLIVLAGLLAIRRCGGGLTRLIWKQALALLHVNDPLHLMFEAPGVIIMTIAATRMHRSLVDFASSDVIDESLKISSLAFPDTKCTDTPSTVPDRAEVVIHNAFGQHPTGSTNDSDSTIMIRESESTWPPMTVSPFPSIPQAQSV